MINVPSNRDVFALKKVAAATPTPTWRAPTPTLRWRITPTPVRVTAKGQRTITQPSETPATDLHFVVYQADQNTAFILDSDINLSVPYGNISTSMGSWPFNDGKNHSVTVNIDGLNVPQGATVNIEAILCLSQYNTIKFKDIQWTYADQPPVKAISAIR